MSFRSFFFPQAIPTPDSEFTAHQCQTMADAQACSEARSVCKVLSNSYTFNTSQNKALRAAVGSDKASYLFNRFGRMLGWTTLKDAQKYYDANKGTKGGTY